MIQTLTSLKDDGFAYLPPEFYYRQTTSGYPRHLHHLQNSFTALKLDTYSPGHRFRAHSAFRWNSTQCRFIQDPMDFYQAPTYNYVDGGINRKFERVSAEVLHNPIFKSLLKKNMEMAQQSDLIEFNETLVMQIHLIRYSPQGEEPAFATPTWLHRDDEPLTFLHLIQLTSNIIGGDSVIATNETYISKVTRLATPLQTYAVNQKYLHAVTPMGKRDEEPGFRDIVIIDFMNKDPNERLIKFMMFLLDHM
uniref:2OG-Fe dioxygenase family protein n=1 Tax=Acrobeloides nanus TaxID=290746 RepID=A0A914DR31_9BILA